MKNLTEIIKPQESIALSKITPLLDWGLIIVEGEDSGIFLQNQLTNSVLDLEKAKHGQLAEGHTQVRLVGYCNPKGRMLASAWIGLFSLGDEQLKNQYFLFLSKDIAKDVAKRLSMFVLRSKVNVRDLSDQWNVSCVHGLDINPASLLSSKNQAILSLPPVERDGLNFNRFIIASLNNDPVLFNQETINANLELSLADWNSLEVLSGIPRIVSNTQDQFIPQMINFESVNGVDFKKGCYPGQEIVARSQYRGVVKRRLQLAHMFCTPPIDKELSNAIKPGSELFNSNDPNQPAGMIVLSAPNPYQPNRIDMQIECKLNKLNEGTLHLGNPSGPVLTPGNIPYSLLQI